MVCRDDTRARWRGNSLPVVATSPQERRLTGAHFDLKSRARCIDCNADVFALTNPENSVFNALKITFTGKRDVKAGTESGTVMIGRKS